MNIPPFSLERYFARYETTVPYLLCGATPESVTMQELLTLDPSTKDRLLQLPLSYPETRGNLELRTHIAGLYSRLDPEHILVHAGSAEGIFNLMNTLFQRGDHLIVHYPCYQSLFQIAEAQGCEITLWETQHETQWKLDLERLQQHIRPNTKGIIINTPHNPTGQVVPTETLFDLVNIANHYGLILFSDEIYRFLEHEPSSPRQSVADLYDNAVSLGGMSKAFGLPGLRIGWLATQNKDILNSVATFKDYTTLSHSSMSEFLAILALQHKDTLIHRNLEIIHQNLPRMDRFFETYADVMEWVRPQAGAAGFPRFKIPVDVDAFCQDLITQHETLLLPGTVYQTSSSHVRIGFGRRDLPTCLGQLESYLRASSWVQSTLRVSSDHFSLHSS